MELFVVDWPEHDRCGDAVPDPAKEIDRHVCTELRVAERQCTPLWQEDFPVSAKIGQPEKPFHNTAPS